MMSDIEKIIYQLEKTAEFLQKFGFGGFEAIRDAIALLKEQDNEIKELRSMVEFWKEKALHT